MEQQYIEDKKVLAVIEMESKTPAGNDMVEVCFEDNTKEIMPKMRFELIKSDKILDPTDFSNIVKARVASICFGSFHEYGVKMGEVNGILDAVTSLVNEGFAKAQNIVWGVDYPGIKLIDINKVLLNNHAKQNNNGTPSEGSGVDTSNKE